MAHRVLRPQPGMEPTLPAVEAWSFNHWTAREVPMWSFLSFLTCIYLLAVPAFIAASRLSLVAASRSSSLVSVPVLLISAASPVEHRLWAAGLSSGSTCACSVVVALGSAAPQHVKSSQTRGRMHWQADSLSLDHQRSSPLWSFLNG